MRSRGYLLALDPFTGIRRRRCRNSTYANWYWQWNVIAMKEVGEYFDCMKQSFR
jgi:hypothetical protein